MRSLGFEHALHCGVQQPNGLQRLAQIVTRNREEAALGSIGLIRFFACAHERIADLAALRHVADRRRHELRIADRERRQADAGRKFAAVRATREQVRDTRAHLPVLRRAQEGGQVAVMAYQESRRQQHVDRLADESIGCVTEHLPHRIVRKNDDAAVVDHDQRVRRSAIEVPLDFVQNVHGREDYHAGDGTIRLRGVRGPFRNLPTVAQCRHAAEWPDVSPDLAGKYEHER